MSATPGFAGRLEGQAKATGALEYEGDVLPTSTLHAALVEASITRGRVLAIDATLARNCPGFVDLITRDAAATLQPSAGSALIRSDEVHFAGQGVAMVVAETRLEADEAARQVRVDYERLTPVTSIHHPDASPYAPAMCGARAPAAIRRGDPEAALAGAAHIVRAHYRTATNNHHPLEPHVGVCWWEGDHLTVNTSTQAIFGTRAVIAHVLQMPPERVRVVSRFLGGGFGCKGQLWFPWLLWTILAARKAGRPVRFEHTRAVVHARRSAFRDRAGPDDRCGRGRPASRDRAPDAGADLDACRTCRSGRFGLAMGVRLRERRHRASPPSHQRAAPDPDARSGRGTGQLRTRVRDGRDGGATVHRPCRAAPAHEETLTDPRTGRIVGPSLAEYLIPTHADIPDFDVVMVDEVDDYLPEGVKGVGMLGHVGSSAAIANAVRWATGRRVRHLPIRIEDLL